MRARRSSRGDQADQDATPRRESHGSTLRYHLPMNSAQRKTLDALFAEPVNGGLEWRRIEALLLALGCAAKEGSGSSITFERDGLRVHFHRPHPGKEALRYRVRDARAFLIAIGVTP